MTHLHRNSFPLPAFPLTSLLSDTSSSFGSASSPYASTPSSTQSIDLTLSFIGHPPPSNPSTHLPSYYPEARHRDTLPSQRSPGAAESSSRPGISADRTRSAAIDPYGIHLLDGVAISPPRPPRSVVSPTYDLTPGASSGEKGASSSRPPESVSLHRNPSATSPRTKQQQPIEQQQQPADGFPSSSSPMQRPASPRSRPSQSGLPPPPMQSSMGAIHDVTTLPEPIPNSASYPGMLFDGLPLTTTDGLLHAPSWGITGPEAKVSGEDYAQALTVYEHILSAIPHIRHHPIYSPPTPPFAKGKAQPFDSLIQLAAEGSQMIAGESSPAGSNAPDEGKQITSPRAQGKRLSTGEKAKPTTKCLGCGATETPEWRRGPMGPRTLCNACGLVHIKLQRKRRKLEEKAAAAASNGDGG